MMRVRLERAPLHYSSSDLAGHPGMYRTWQDGHDYVLKVDAACPGCGSVWNLPEGTHPLLGLSCPVEIHARVCCGWRGYITDGWWVPLGGEALEADQS